MCGHTKKLSCYVDAKTHLCDTLVDDVSPLCKHAVKRKCHEKPEDVACPSPCEDRLECGHACRLNCHKKHDPDHLDVSKTDGFIVSVLVTVLMTYCVCSSINVRNRAKRRTKSVRKNINVKKCVFKSAACVRFE